MTSPASTASGSPAQLTDEQVRRERAPYKGYWDIPGGFLEADEAPEKGALREAREETGLRVRVDTLLGVYHDKNGDDFTFNVYYRAHPVGGHEKPGDDAKTAGVES